MNKEAPLVPKLLFAAEILLVLAVAIIPRVLTLGGTFVVNDETLYWDWSNQFTQALLNQDWAGTIVGDVYPSVTVMWVQDINFGLRWLWAWLTGSLDPQFYYQLALDRPLDFALLGERRLAMALANAGVVVLIYFYTRALFGRGVALVSVLLIGLDPFYLSDARTLRGDSLMAGFMTLSVLGLLLANQQQSLRQLFFSAVMAGLSLLTKMSALPIFIFGSGALVGLGLTSAWTARGQLKLRLHSFWQSGLWPAVVWLAIASLICFILWPALWFTSGQVLEAMFQFAADSADGGRTGYFMGHIIDNDPAPLFYPVTLFFRSTPLTLIGLIILLIACVYWAHLHKRSNFFTPRITALIVIGFYCLIYVTIMTLGVHKRSWYLLPVFPAMMILAAQGWVWLAGQIYRRWVTVVSPKAWPVVSTAAIAGMLAIQVVQAVPFHPYYYTYWNPLAVGKFAPVQLEMLGWGIDTSLAAQWLNAQPQPEQLKVAVRPSIRELRPMFKGDIIPFASERLWAQADYIVLRQRHLQLVEENEPYQLEYLRRLSPVYTLTLNDVIFGWIYPGPKAQVALNSELTGKATLLGYTLPAQPLVARQSAPLKLYWRHEGIAPGEQLFVHLVDNDGFIWKEASVVSMNGFEEASTTREAIVYSQADLNPEVGTPPGTYFLKIGIEQRQSRQSIGEFALSNDYDKLTVAPTVVPPALPALTHSKSQAFGADLRLLGYNWPSSLPASSEVIDLYWQAQREIKTDYVLALRLRDQSQREVWYQLARPARGIYPTPGWKTGEIVRDPWSTPANNVAAPGHYTLELEVYDANANQSRGKMTLGNFEIGPAGGSE